MDEKDVTYIEEGMTDAEREAALVDRKGSVIGEAAVYYGDVETAERLGYVQRGLKSRHIQFIALGGTIGTGLFVGISSALATSGPLGILMGYTLTGFFVYFMMQGLGEMATWIPMPGAIPQMAARYADPALGFAVGWNQWYSNALTQCVEISAAAQIIQYWEVGDPTPINSAAWISIIIVLIVCLNIFAVSIYGEAEFCFAAVKIVTIVGLLILAFIIDLGGSPRHERLGFHYWKNPGALNNLSPAHGAWGQFLGFLTVLINAAFSYSGVESVAVAAGEAEDPRRNIPKAVKRVFWRILFFYVLGSLAIGVMVPYNDPRLQSGHDDARSSPWVIGIQIAQIDVLPSIINAVILTSAASAANAFLYTGSRYLFGIAQNGHAPRIFLKCSKRGLPYFAVAFTALFSLLTYMTVSAGASTVFFWFYNLTTIANLFTWCVICITSIRFRKALKAQNVDPNTLPFKSWGMPYLAYAGTVFFAFTILLNGFYVFMNSGGPNSPAGWDISTFFTQYIGIPIFFILYLGYKIITRAPVVRPETADIWTGKAAVDAEIWPEIVPKNFLQRVWFWIA